MRMSDSCAAQDLWCTARQTEKQGHIEVDFHTSQTFLAVIMLSVTPQSWQCFNLPLINVPMHHVTDDQSWILHKVLPILWMFRHVGLTDWWCFWDSNIQLVSVTWRHNFPAEIKSTAKTKNPENVAVWNLTVSMNSVFYVFNCTFTI